MKGGLSVSMLRVGHEVRRPGESEWLPVESVERFPFGVRLRAGGREFVTQWLAKWPTRVVQS